MSNVERGTRSACARIHTGPSSARQARNDDFVDAVTIEIDDFQAPLIDDNNLARMGDPPDGAEDESGERRELCTHR
jgi:hypothetical protein